MRTARRTTILALTLTSGLVLAGCNGSDSSTAAGPSSTAGTDQSAAFNEVDVRFTQGMLPHHMQAVRNSEIEIAMGGAPEVKAIAQKILTEQKKEIETMQGFLKTFGAPEKQAPPDQQAVWDKNTAELRDAATPEARDVVFLTNMVPHHSAAIPMAQLDVTQGKYLPAQELAMQIKTVQRMEIVEMNMLIRARTRTP